MLKMDTEGDAELLELEKLLGGESEEDFIVETKAKKELNIPANVKNLVPKLTEDKAFAEAFTCSADIVKPVVSANEEVDALDDDEVKKFLERKYNEYGCDIENKLKNDKNAKHEAHVERQVMNIIAKEEEHLSTATTSSNQLKQQANRIGCSRSSSHNWSPTVAPKVAIYTDPKFGFRLINPLISTSLLVEHMNGKHAVSFANLVLHTQQADLSQDWVIAGVIVSKNPVRTTKKDEPFSIWRISDLRGDIKTVSLFLFGKAHKELWKTAQGMCLAILNPSVMEKRSEAGDIASLSIDTAKKVIILGQSKDFGVCKSKKRNGDACTSVVNLSECDYCIYHMKQEYGKMSRRSELQSASLGRGLNELRNKVLGKSEVFYGGQSFTAIPVKKNPKLVKKDMDRLSSLSEYAVSPFSREQNHKSTQSRTASEAVPYAARSCGPVSKIAGNVESSTKQRLKDLERLKVLDEAEEKSRKTIEVERNIPSSATIPALITTVPDKFKDRQFSFCKQTPKLSSENFSLEVNVSSTQANWAKQKALNILKQKPLEKVNPNSTRGSRDGKRRAIDELNEQFIENDAKRVKHEENQKEQERKSRLQRIMDATSTHTNLIAMREEDEREKYFNRQEKKEALEEKMLQTYRVPCKAVICFQCKYTAFSAADRCKEEKHKLKVVDAQKRFFKCGDCGNRTATVFKLPKTSCKTCKGSNWLRDAMIRERKACDANQKLCLRGDEESFLGSLATKGNLNLLVPDEQ